MNIPQQYWWIYPLIILDLVLKGFGLWIAARKDHKYWFVALILVNSFGILPLIYLVFFSKWEVIEKYKKQIFKKRK